MKPAGFQFGPRLLLLLLLLPWVVDVTSQNPYTGRWEGNFMGDFRTIILISYSEEAYTGTIRMYNGPQVIQNDPITDITVEGARLTFRIPDKETSFLGKFNAAFTLLTGNFIFPDGSEHPIEVEKSTDGAQLIGNTAEKYRDYLEKRFDPESLREDLRFLMKKLKRNHPRIYSYTPEGELESECERILSEVTGSMGLEEYLRHIAPLVEMVHCSHTGIRLPSEYQMLVAEFGHYFPLTVAVNDRSIFYLSSAEQLEPPIEPGAEIISINGRSAPEIISGLLTLVPSEGYNSSSKYYQLNHRFHSLFHLLDPSDRFEVEFLTETGKRKVILQACKMKEIYREDAGEGNGLPVQFTLDENGSAGLLRVSSFEIRNMEGYMGELNRIFSQLQTREIKNLILDLRGNSGGHPIFAAQLLSFLVDGDFTYFRENPEVPEFEPLYHPMHSDPHHFRGMLYVLVDGGCLSTAGHLISLIKYHTPAMFIGEEPGSTFRCNDFSMQVSLPHTSIEANIPRMTFETAVEGFREGVPFPVDYPVSFTISDVVDGIDRSLELSKEMVAEN
jgi:hypothetical protein